MADSSSDTSSSISVVVRFVFRLAGGSSAKEGTSRGSRRAGALSWASEGQGDEVAVGGLAMEARFRRRTPDVGTGFVEVTVGIRISK